MTKTMADVLAEHQSIAWNHVTGKAICDGCDETLGPMTTGMEKQEALLISHQAAALTAAGYGLVANAKREALEEAADDVDGPLIELRQAQGKSFDWLCGIADAEDSIRARAAEMRQG